MSEHRSRPIATFSAVIRSARIDDLDALLALERAAFAGDHATRRALRHAVRSPSMNLLVAIAEDGRSEILVGAATLERRVTSRVARLASIAVSPARTGQGLGGFLLDAVESEAAAHDCFRIRLESRIDNGAAIRLYERHGYRRYAVRHDYYERGATAWCYEKMLAAR